MNGKDLLNGLGFVDDELVQVAEQKKIKKSSIKFIIPIAASFATVVTAFSIWTNHQKPPSMLPNDNIPPIVSDESSNDNKDDALESANNKEYTLHFNDVGSQTAAQIRIIGHFWEELTSMQAEKLLPDIAEKYQIEGMVNYSHEDGKTSIFDVNTTIKENNKEIKITIAPGEIKKCYIFEGEPILSEIEGIKIEAGMFTTDKNSRGEQNHIYYANFKLDDVAYYVEYAGEESEQKFFTSIIADIVLGGKADLSLLENPVVPKLCDDKLSESESYAEVDFGVYLPEIPKSYLFQDATRFINQSEDYLIVSWFKGYDDVRMTISKIKEQDKGRIVSIRDTELYDMSLYPIPWADSMPSDTREIIANPIFKIEDLTVNIIKMREYIYSEQGDPSGNSVNMNFSVLYDDVLVEITTEGVSSEYLFDALSKLPRN